MFLYLLISYCFCLKFSSKSEQQIACSVDTGIFLSEIHGAPVSWMLFWCVEHVFLGEREEELSPNDHKIRKNDVHSTNLLKNPKTEKYNKGFENSWKREIYLS